MTRRLVLASFLLKRVICIGPICKFVDFVLNKSPPHECINEENLLLALLTMVAFDFRRSRSLLGGGKGCAVRL